MGCGNIGTLRVRTSYSFVSHPNSALLGIPERSRRTFLGNGRRFSLRNMYQYIYIYICMCVCVYTSTFLLIIGRIDGTHSRSGNYQLRIVCTFSYPLPRLSYSQFDTSFFLQFRAYCWNEQARRRQAAATATATVVQASGNF